MQEERFEFQIQQTQIHWTFNLQPQLTQKMDYFEIDQKKRSLSDLINDIDFQLSNITQKSKKKQQVTDRVVRKLCQKVLKHLQIKLSSFCNQIQEDKKIVKEYFKKQLNDQEAKQRITKKAKQYLMGTLVSLPRQQVVEISKKYMQSFFFKEVVKGGQDGYNQHLKQQTSKCIDDLYLTFMKDNFKPHSKQLHVDTDNLIQIDLNLNIDQKYIGDSFLWDANKTYEADIWMYTEYLLRDLLIQNQQVVDKNTFQMLHEQCRTQLKSQLEYKSLLKKYKSLLLNFSTIEIASDLKEFNIPIEIKIIDQKGQKVYEDSFEWDILNDNNNIEQFCEIIIQDEKIPRKYFSELSYQIRLQIYNQLHVRFNNMTNTFRSILKQRQNPKLNTQATSQIKKNIIYSMDIPVQYNPDGYKMESNIEFNNSEMYSLVSRNIQLVPEELQEKIIYSEVKKEKQTTRINPKMVNNFVKSNNLKFENNTYIPPNIFSYFDSSKLKYLYNTAVSREA